MIDQSVADVMTRPAHTISGETTASELARLFAENRIGSAVVVDPDTDALVGIVTESDIIRQVALDADTTTVPARSFMTTEVVTVGSTDSIDDAARLMTDHSIRRLPVVDDGDIVGILTTTNLTHYLPRLRDAVVRTRKNQTGE